MSKKQTQKSHRHFVAIPLFIALILLPLLQGGTVGATLQPSDFVNQSNEGEIVSITDGVHAVITTGNGFDLSNSSNIVFLDGSALVWSEGRSKIHALGYDISSFDGTYSISVYGNTLTIAALDIPVLIKFEDKMVLVPAEMQWRSSDLKLVSYHENEAVWTAQRKVQNVPQNYAIRQKETLSSLKSSVISSQLPNVLSALPSGMQKTLSNIRLPVAKRYAIDTWQQDVFGYTRNLLDSGDVSSVNALIHSDEYTELFSSAQGKAFLCLYLHSSTNPSVIALLVEYLSYDEEMELLLSFHPKFRDIAWIIGNIPVSTEAKILQIFMFPISDRLQNAVGLLAMPRWINAAADLSSLVKNPSGFYSSLIIESANNAIYLNNRGYPRRARDWADALQTLADESKLNLSKDAWKSLDSLARFHSVDATQELDFSDPDTTNENNERNLPLEARRAKWGENNENNESFSPDAVESVSYSILQEMGAVFMVETSISAVAPNTAEVNNILFSTSEGDFVFSFALDVSTALLTNISRNGQTYPYGLSKDAFEKWIGR